MWIASSPRAIPTSCYCVKDLERKRSTASVDYPDAFVPPHLTCEIRGRIDPKGRELTPLFEDDARDAVLRLKAQGVEAIAVVSLVDRQRRTRAPRPRDYCCGMARGSRDARPRAQSDPTSTGARLRPLSTRLCCQLVSSYVEGLETALREAGFEKELLIANCVGGMMPGRDIAKRPIFSVMSGPTLAPIAAKYLTREGESDRRRHGRDHLRHLRPSVTAN